jgi:hypothetical protein
LLLAFLEAGEPLVMVIDRDGQDFFGFVLANHVIIEKFLDFAGLQHAVRGGARRASARAFSGFGTGRGLAGSTAVEEFFVEDLVAEIDAFIANVDSRPGNQLADLLLGLATKRTLEMGVKFRHTGCP